MERKGRTEMNNAAHAETLKARLAWSAYAAKPGAIVARIYSEALASAARLSADPESGRLFLKA